MNQFPEHIFTAPGNYSWKVVASAGAVSATNTGNIVITAPVTLATTPVQNSSLNLAWPPPGGDAIVEQSDSLGTSAHWTVVTNIPVIGPASSTINVPVAEGSRFYRIRQPW
jgi:PKD repeat protein